MHTSTATPVPVGPKGRFLLGSLPDYSRNPLQFMTDCARTYGDVVYLTGLLPTYLLSHPSLIEEMLVGKQQYLIKSKLSTISKPLLGNGLLLSEGEFWKQQRHLMQPTFHRSRIAAYAKTMVDYTQQMLNHWQSGESRDIHHEMMTLTLAIVAKTFFGSEVASDVDVIDRAMQTMLRQFDRRSTNLLLFLLPDAIPTPANLNLRHDVRQMDAVVYRLICERRAGPETDDLLSMLLHLQAEDGTRMSDQQVRDEVNTFLLAGHETTAIVLSWVWYLLGQHPQVEAKLLSELQTVLAGRSPSFTDLPQLRYTEWIVLEAMRLYPPVWAIPRTVTQTCEIGGYPLKAGLGLVASPWIVHRDPRWFDQPECFNPDRWANDLAKRLPSFAYFPFGGGSRICIGKAFAMMEACLLLATIAATYRIKLVANQTVEPWPSITLRPKRGIQVVLEKR